MKVRFLKQVRLSYDENPLAVSIPGLTLKIQLFPPVVALGSGKNMLTIMTLIN